MLEKESVAINQWTTPPSIIYQHHLYRVEWCGKASEQTELAPLYFTEVDATKGGRVVLSDGSCFENIITGSSTRKCIRKPCETGLGMDMGEVPPAPGHAWTHVNY